MVARQVLTLKIEVRVLAGEILTALMLASLVGCVPLSSVNTRSNSSDISGDADVQGKVTDDLEQRSQALHHYLIGQLAYAEQDRDLAFKSLEQAGQLVNDPAPLLHSRLAEMYVRKGDLLRALPEAEKASSQEPENLASKLLFAGVLAELGEFDKAVEVYKASLKLDPKRTSIGILLTGLLSQQGRVEESRDILKVLVVQDQKDPLLELSLGRSEELLGKLSDAEAHYRRSSQISGERKVAVVDLIRVLMRQGKTKAAQVVCEGALKGEPSDPLMLRLKTILAGTVEEQGAAANDLEKLELIADKPTNLRFRVALSHIERQEFSDAIRELSLVTAKEPNNFDARYYLSSMLAGSGRRKEAVVELFLIDKTSPLFVKSRTLAAFILRQDQDLERAEVAVREALSEDQTNQPILLFLVLILRDRANFTEAEELLKRALQDQPQSEKLLYNLSLVLNDQDRDEDSLVVMEQVLALNPDNVEALNYVAYSLAEQGGDLERAELLIGKALAVRPNDGFFLDTLGWVYLKSKRLEKAEDCLSRAVAASGDDVVIVEHYVEALIAQSKFELAASVLKGVLAKDAGNHNTDRERREAVERLRKRLEKLLRDYPALKNVREKTIPQYT